MTVPGVTLIGTAEEAREFASWLHDTARRRVAVLATTRAGGTEPLIDVADVLDAVGHVADVYVLLHGDASYAFAAAMEPGAQAYGGASRVYPVGTDWARDLSKSPLRFVWSDGRAPDVTAAIIGDALTAGARAGLGSRQVRRDAPTVVAKVTGTPTTSQAIVKLDSGSFGMVRTSQTFPGVPADRLLTAGMRITGRWHSDDRELDVVGLVPSPEQREKELDPGEWLPVRVETVNRREVRLALLPGWIVSVPASEIVEDGEDLRDLVSAGEVVLVCYVGGSSPVSFVGPHADRVRPALAVWPGGPPWLAAEETSDGTAEQGETELTAVESPADSHEPSSATNLSGDPVDALQGEIDRLQQTLRTKEVEIERLRKQNRASRLKASKRWAGPTDFVAAVQQLRWDVETAWVDRIPAAEKESRPLVDYTIGPGFVDSLSAVEGVTYGKVLDVVVEVLTGIANDSAGRQMHQLRSGSGGNDPVVVDGDGRTAWRVNLQTKTASARRLHFWRDSRGGIELSRVALHDDMRP